VTIMSLSKYVLMRLIHAIPTLIGIVLIMFILVRVLPGDPARLIAGMEATEEDVQKIREILGLNKPLHEQFIDYISSLLKGDLGTSLKFGTPVIKEIMARFPYTVQLAIVAELFAVLIGIPLGIISAVKPYTKSGYVSTIISLIGSSMPIYWLGLMLIYLFSVHLRLLPSHGAGTPRHIILPAITLAVLLMGNIVRITRTAMIESLESNYITTARAKGLSEKIVVYRHALKNAAIPIVTIMGLQLGSLMGGAILTESVFAWPGLGLLLVDSIFFRDYPLIQGIILFFATVFVILNIIVDVIYALIDPRVRESLWMREQRL